MIMLDMLFVKGLERRLGRSLTEQETNLARQGVSLYLKLTDIGWDYVQIPVLAFPYDLLSQPEDRWNEQPVVEVEHRYAS